MSFKVNGRLSFSQKTTESKDACKNRLGTRGLHVRQLAEQLTRLYTVPSKINHRKVFDHAIACITEILDAAAGLKDDAQVSFIELGTVLMRLSAEGGDIVMGNHFKHFKAAQTQTPATTMETKFSQLPGEGPVRASFSCWERPLL